MQYFLIFAFEQFAANLRAHLKFMRWTLRDLVKHPILRPKLGVKLGANTTKA